MMVDVGEDGRGLVLRRTMMYLAKLSKTMYASDPSANLDVLVAGLWICYASTLLNAR